MLVCVASPKSFSLPSRETSLQKTYACRDPHGETDGDVLLLPALPRLQRNRYIRHTHYLLFWNHTLEYGSSYGFDALSSPLSEADSGILFAE